MRLALVILVCLFAPVTAIAQAPGSGTPPSTLTPAWQDGFVLQSESGDYRLQLGAVVQVDGRFPLDDPQPVIGTFTIRKARVAAAGRLARYFDFRFMPEFAGGNVVMLDAYVDTRFSQAFRLRAGKDKTPIGYELLIGDGNLPFPERALPSALVPNRDVGFQAQGDLLRQKLTYAGGIFNGVVDGTSSTADQDPNSAKDFAGRILVQPFRPAAGEEASAISGLGFHLGGSAGTQSGPLPSYRTSIGQVYFAYAAGTVADGARRRITPAVFYFYRSFGTFAEYIRSTQEVTLAGIRQEVANHGWEITGAYMLTGEPASTGVIRPRRPFDPENGQWGALQVLARYAALDVDDQVFASGLAAANASPSARSYTASVNWYPTAFVKWYASFERTQFGESAAVARPDEDVILFRAQLAF